MVNLKDHYKKISENEQIFLKEIPKLLNFVNNKDTKLQKSFVQKTILSIKEIFKQEDLNTQNKYFCLQFLNIAMEQQNDFFITCFAQHMYDFLIQLIQSAPDKKSEKNMARYLFSSNDTQQQNYSKKFFYLLLELFEYWGTKRPFKNNSKYSTFKVLKEEGIQFPRKDTYRYKYLKQNNQPQQQEVSNDSQNLNKLFEQLEENYNELQDLLNDEDFYIDDFKSVMKKFVIDFKNILDYKIQFNRKQEEQFQTYDQFMELYMENSDNLRQFKKKYQSLTQQQNPFQEKDFQSLDNSEKNKNEDKQQNNEQQQDNHNNENIQPNLDQFENYIKTTRKQAMDKVNELKKKIQKQQEINLRLQEQIYGANKKIQIAQQQVDDEQKINNFFKYQSKLFQKELQSKLQKQKQTKNETSNYKHSLKKQNTYYQTQYDKKIPIESFKLHNNSLQKINNSFQYQNQSLHEPKNYQNIESLKNNIAQNSDFLNSLNQEIQSLLNRKKDYAKINNKNDVIPNRSQSLIPDQDFKERIAKRNFKNSYYQQPTQFNRFSQKKSYGQYSNQKNNYKKDERLSHISNLSFDINSSQYNAGIFRFKQQN